MSIETEEHHTTEPYACPDASSIAEGVLLTPGASLLAPLLAKDRPVSVTDIERALLEERVESVREPSEGSIAVGRAYLSPWGDLSYSLAAPGHGLLPGRWLGRETALGAYGYILGGGQPEVLRDLTDHVGRDAHWGSYITFAELRHHVLPPVVDDS